MSLLSGIEEKWMKNKKIGFEGSRGQGFKGKNSKLKAWS
jgi:hypothetical protein